MSGRPLLLMALVLGCGGDDGHKPSDTDTDVDTDTDTDTDTDADTDTDTSPPADNDGDGYDDTVDCDDTDPSVNPAAVEVCDNGVDDDCDGGAGRCTFSGAIPVGGSVHHDGWPGDGLGNALDASRDMNGDGLNELLVGAKGARAGKGDVYYTTQAAAGGVMPSSADLHLRGSGSDALGTAVALAGDLTGDGVNDLLVSGPDRDDQGAVWLVPSTATGDHLVENLATLTWTGDLDNDWFGHDIAAPGDLTGDGLSDIVITAVSYDGPAIESGAVAIFAGPLTAGGGVLQADAALFGDNQGDQLGFGLATGLDLNGDGSSDLATGANLPNVSPVVGVFLGPFSGNRTLANADAVLSAEDGANGDSIWEGLSAAGDVNGDGLDDLLLGDPELDSYTGMAYLVHGMPGDLDLFLADARIHGDQTGTGTGWETAPAGDIDGDGFADVLIASPSDDLWGYEAGVAYLFYGPFSGTQAISSADATFTPPQPQANLGFAMAAPGDLTGDGLPDLWISAVGANLNGAWSGSVFLVPGDRL